MIPQRSLVSLWTAHRSLLLEERQLTNLQGSLCRL